MTTRRALATIATVALALTACGGGDDDAEPADEPAAEQQDDEPAADEAAETPAEEPADADEPDDGSDDQTGDDGSDEGGDEGGDGDTIVARSLDDVPERCRDLMADYFQAVEPIVSEIDWETASFDDLEQIGTDIEEASSEFETSTMEEECDSIEFPDGNEFEILIEFARDEAPGVVGYLEFIDGLGFEDDGGGEGGGTDEGAIPTPGEGFADCDEAVDYVQGLIDQYDSFQDVPAADIMQIAGLGSVIVTCTPEQLEFFDSPEVTAFLEAG